MNEMRLTDHQHAVWSRMIDLIQNYKDGKLHFSALVRDLQGALDASEVRNQQLVEKWYDLWQPLEISNALEGDQVSRSQVANDIEAIEQFVRGVISR